MITPTTKRHYRPTWIPLHTEKAGYGYAQAGLHYPFSISSTDPPAYCMMPITPPTRRHLQLLIHLREHSQLNSFINLPSSNTIWSGEYTTRDQTFGHTFTRVSYITPWQRSASNSSIFSGRIKHYRITRWHIVIAEHATPLLTGNRPKNPHWSRSDTHTSWLFPQSSVYVITMRQSALTSIHITAVWQFWAHRPHFAKVTLATSTLPRSISSIFKLSSPTICSKLLSHRDCIFSFTKAFKSSPPSSLLVMTQPLSAIVKSQSFSSTLDVTLRKRCTL